MNARKWNRLRKKLPHLLKWWPNWERLPADWKKRCRKANAKTIEAKALALVLADGVRDRSEFPIHPHQWKFGAREQPVKKV